MKLRETLFFVLLLRDAHDAEARKRINLQRSGYSKFYSHAWRTAYITELQCAPSCIQCALTFKYFRFGFCTFQQSLMLKLEIQKYRKILVW